MCGPTVVLSPKSMSISECVAIATSTGARRFVHFPVSVCVCAAMAECGGCAADGLHSLLSVSRVVHSQLCVMLL